MRKNYTFLGLLVAIVFFSQYAFSQPVKFDNSWGKQGITLQKQNDVGVTITYSIQSFSFVDIEMDGQAMKTVKLPDVFLPNDAGAPDLPGTGNYIAVPNGAEVTVEIISGRTELLKNQLIAPAPQIPLDTENGPLHYEKDMKIYSRDAFYPAQPVILSEKTRLRGVDVVMLGITPFQYNPVTKELLVYRDMEIKVTFEGGTGTFGDERLRSRWWDPILNNELLNASSLPRVDYNKPKAPTDTPDYEYLIISPNDPDFLAWADSIKQFRTLQGIYTGIVTTDDIGGNTVNAIETYVDDAYNNWTVPPSAVLLLGDYGTSGASITSQIYSHPAGYPDFVSDNKFADVTGNDLPDIAFARITGNNAAELEVMITKFLDYERNPPTSADFYNHPITALGWQTERWFQICSEVVGGYLKNVQGKDPVRINAVYSGNPSSDPWSTATNTTTVLNYFGPNGLGYIPSTPQELGGFSGGTATDVINAINDGSYMLQHRDHGMYTGWGEPSFTSTSINSLNNINNELPFIFSINCQTGAFHRSSESFAEKFHRHTYNGQNSGALGIIAATEVSYSFVNDVYVWGVFDNMHPDFMPGYNTTFPVNYAMPAFGNAAGKHFLYQSSWPYNTSNKQITYRLFHHHGDAFLTLYTEVPQNLNISHSPALEAGATSFGVTADAGSFIALTCNGAIIGTADGTGSEVLIPIPQQNPGDKVLVTVTKQNYYRYSSKVDVVSSGLFAQFSGTPLTLCSGGSVNFTDQSFGSPTTWNWSFPGGTPSSFSGQTPPSIVYNSPGSYNVTLTIGDGSSTDDEVKTGYITVEGITADFTGSPTTLVIGNSVSFTDNTSCDPTSWNWSFPGGTPSSSSAQNPVITYNTPGTYSVTLNASNATGSDDETKTNYIEVTEVPLNYCTSQGNNYSYEWIGQVDFNSFSNPSGASGYTNFTNLTVDMDAGSNVNVSLTPQFSSSTYVEYWRIWIDYNRDGDFDDAGEEVFAPASSSSTINGSFTVDAGATGKTRMRVSMKWNGVPTQCETFSYGEVEDYTVDFGSQLPPEADFSGSPTSLLEGESVQFNNLSTNNPTSWSWTFNGGSPSSSTSQNPVVIYNTAGNYTVELTATNAAGFDIETKVNYITVHALPECATLVSPANGGTNLSISTDLDWGSATNATGYKIFFGTNNPPTNIANGTDLGNVTLYDPAGNLDWGTTYYWKVVPYNAFGDATGCNTWSFTTEQMPPPACATLVAPTNTATDISIAVNLDWNSVADASGYKIFFGTDNPPTNIENGTDLENVTLYNPSGDLLYMTTYYWKVVAYNAGGDATGCVTWSFTTEQMPPPPCATLAAPANGGNNILITTDLDWNSVTDASGYKIYFGTDNPPTNIENGTDLGNVTQYNPDVDLLYSTTYYWKVIAYNAGGDASGCATWSFTTEDEPVQPPACATLVAPGDEATDVLITTDLSWNGVLDATGYKMYFGTDNPPTNIVNGTDLGDVNSYDPLVDLDYYTTYYWKIIAYNAGGDATGCSTWSFTTELMPPPPCATLVSPADGATDMNITIDLNWNGVAGANGYTLYFGTDNPPTNIENGTDLGNVTFYDPDNLSYSTTYYWRVVAYNPGGEASSCSTWVFTTEDEPIVPPACATLDSPSNGVSNVLISTDLAWNAVANATGYMLNFGTDNPPTNLENGTDLGNETLYNPVLDLAYSTTYYWQVIAYNAGGDATGCSTWSFTTEAEPVLPPTCATLSSPGNGAGDVAISATLNWNSAADADGYKLYFGTDNPPANIEDGLDLGNVTTYTPSGLSYSTSYYWQVIAYNTGGEATGCSTWSFTTEDQPTGPTELLYSNFEDGWGYWTDGGGDCYLYTSGTYAPQGSNAGAIQDNSGVASSFYMTNGIDIHTPGYIQLNIEFDFIAISMDNAKEDFWVQYFDGTTWITVASYAKTIDFENGILYSKNIPVMESEYNFPTDMKIRFMCDASGNADDVYIDEIRLTASTTLEPPTCASADSPTDGASDVSIFTNLDWGSELTATGYYLYFGTDYPPTNLVNGADVGDVTIFDPVNDLLNNTIYYWKIVPYNDGGNAVGCPVWSFTTEAETVAFDELSFTDFESGWGIWTDGGGDCSLYTGGTYAPQGNNAGDIQDNSGIASSFYMTNGVDVHNPGYVQIDVEFEFIAVSMDNTSEDFWVQYYDGSVWNTIATYIRKTDFDNNVHYAAKANIFEADYSFPTDMKIRFMCDASGNADDVYIDQIRISASTQTDPDTYLVVVSSDNPGFVGVEETELAEFSIYPNPASNFVNISSEAGTADVLIYNIYGKLVKQVAMHENQLQIDISDLDSGMYIINIISQEEINTEKLIKR